MKKPFIPTTTLQELYRNLIDTQSLSRQNQTHVEELLSAYRQRNTQLVGMLRFQSI